MREGFALKLRVRFTKNGSMKFIGHLDTMQYFQKAIRRAELPAAFTAGFSPHMILSFAAPLGVGVTSQGEYFDLELAEDMDPQEFVRRLDAQMVDGFSVTAAKAIENRKSNAMSLVAAADYEVGFRPGYEPSFDWQSQIPAFLAQPEILITKTGKAGERQVDIRPWIYRMQIKAPRILFLRLASASANYTRPDQVMEAFFAMAGEKLSPHALLVNRLEVYARKPETAMQGEEETDREPEWISLLEAL